MLKLRRATKDRQQAYTKYAGHIKRTGLAPPLLWGTATAYIFMFSGNLTTPTHRWTIGARRAGEDPLMGDEKKKSVCLPATWIANRYRALPIKRQAVYMCRQQAPMHRIHRNSAHRKGAGLQSPGYYAGRDPRNKKRTSYKPIPTTRDTRDTHCCCTLHSRRSCIFKSPQPGI